MSSKYKFVYIFIILVVFSFVFYGCAEGGLTNGAGSEAMTSSCPASGNIKLVINWPQKVKNFTPLESHSINGGVLPAQFLTGFIKTIPATATQIAIDVYKADTETSTLIPTTTVHRSTETSSVTTTIVGIPIGNIKIKAAALNSSGTTLATGNTTTMLQQCFNRAITAA